MYRVIFGTCFFLLLHFLSISLFMDASICFGLSNGLYHSLSNPDMKLDLAEGDYDHWIEKGDDIVELQFGSYEVRGNFIQFKPQSSDVGDMSPSRAVIVDNCRIRWGKKGVFLLDDCQNGLENGQIVRAAPTRVAQHDRSDFPQKWRIVRKGGLELYVPEKAQVQQENNGVTISFRDAKAQMVALEQGRDLFTYLEEECRPRTILQQRQTWFFLCGPGARHKFMEIVTKGTPSRLLTCVQADDMSTFKALSIAISSLRRTGPSQAPKPGLHVALRRWSPADSSYSILVPEGWKVQGGTADLGRNGYVRMVKADSPDGEASFLGCYCPFYQFSQTVYGTAGMPPVDGVSYVKDMFFGQLAQRYGIVFDNLKLSKLDEDRELSQRLTSEAERLARRVAVSASVRYEAVKGSGSCTQNGQLFDVAITGVLQYTKMPLMGAGYSYSWGPGPLFVETARQGLLNRWHPIFLQMAESWQPSDAWLARHNQMAMRDAQQSLRHFRKMSRMIHENAERRMESGMKEWESQENQNMEIFWDAFYALGGEDRYDEPDTGEEIDVPTGADKYLYDRLSQVWVGVRMDQPGAQDLIQELKQKGFVELRPHTY